MVNANQILVLKDGHIVERGTHEELLSLPGVYAGMWNQQLEKEAEEAEEGEEEEIIEAKKDAKDLNSLAAGQPKQSTSQAGPVSQVPPTTTVLIDGKVPIGDPASLV